jgi:thiosulfate/3-mercaptopyruvate sulfurtransferase
MMTRGHLPPVVGASWLAEHADRVVTADVRWYLDGRSGLAAYRAGHLPGAVFIDLERWLSAPASDAGGRHPLPAPEVFAEGMARAGIGDHTQVVAYDDAGGTIAARLVWMLRTTGHAAALLDGGIQGWPGALETAEAPRPRASFTALLWPEEHLARIDDVASGGARLLDARARTRYRGEPDGLDPRAGHIPGAASLPCRDNLDAEGRFLAPDALRRRFEGAGVGPDTPVISYCGSGVTACHNLLALERAGLGPGRLFPGSWSQWSRDPSRPIEVGDPPR